MKEGCAGVRANIWYLARIPDGLVPAFAPDAAPVRLCAKQPHSTLDMLCIQLGMMGSVWQSIALKGREGGNHLSGEQSLLLRSTRTQMQVRCQVVYSACAGLFITEYLVCGLTFISNLVLI